MKKFAEGKINALVFSLYKKMFHVFGFNPEIKKLFIEELKRGKLPDGLIHYCLQEYGRLIAPVKEDIITVFASLIHKSYLPYISVSPNYEYWCNLYRCLWGTQEHIRHLTQTPGFRKQDIEHYEKQMFRFFRLYPAPGENTEFSYRGRVYVFHSYRGGEFVSCKYLTCGKWFHLYYDHFLEAWEQRKQKPSSDNDTRNR